MTCNDVQRLLSDGFDRQLRPDEAQAVRSHLAGCATCAAFERSLATGVAAIGGLPRLPGSARVRESVMAQVQVDGSWGRRPRGARSWASQGLKLAGAGLAFGLVAVVLVAVLGSGGNGRDLERGRAGSGASSSPTAPAATVGATAGSELPDCRGDQVDLALDVALHRGDPAIASPGFVSIDLAAPAGRAGSDAACRLASPVTVTITDADGVPLDIQGNGLVVEPGDVASLGFAWMNWCGAEGPFTVSVALENADAGQSLDVVPPCFDPAAPSTFGQAAEAVQWPELPFCDLDQVELALSSPAAAAGSIGFEVVAAGTTGDPADCHIPLTFTLEDAEGRPLVVMNNGLMLSLDVRLPDGPSSTVVLWSNWCGDDALARMHVTGPEIDLLSGAVSPPGCNGPELSSQLLPAAGAEPLPATPTCTEWHVVEPNPDGTVTLWYVVTLVEQCDPSIPVQLSLVKDQATQQAQKAAEVIGDPLSLTLREGTGDLAGYWYAGAVWSNWCGDTPVGLQTERTGPSFGSGSYSTPLETPTCVDPAQPSSLVASDAVPDPGVLVRSE
jgi:hypothetical protein